MMYDQGEGSEILDAIVAKGRCGTCGTPWDSVVNVDGKRPVKIQVAGRTKCASWETGTPVVMGPATSTITTGVLPCRYREASGITTGSSCDLDNCVLSMRFPDSNI